MASAACKGFETVVNDTQNDMDKWKKLSTPKDTSENVYADWGRQREFTAAIDDLFTRDKTEKFLTADDKRMLTDLNAAKYTTDQNKLNQLAYIEQRANNPGNRGIGVVDGTISAFEDVSEKATQVELLRRVNSPRMPDYLKKTQAKENIAASTDLGKSSKLAEKLAARYPDDAANIEKAIYGRYTKSTADGILERTKGTGLLSKEDETALIKFQNNPSGTKTEAVIVNNIKTKLDSADTVLDEANKSKLIPNNLKDPTTDQGKATLREEWKKIQDRKQQAQSLIEDTTKLKMEKETNNITRFLDELGNTNISDEELDNIRKTIADRTERLENYNKALDNLETNRTRIEEIDGEKKYNEIKNNLTRGKEELELDQPVERAVEQIKEITGKKTAERAKIDNEIARIKNADEKTPDFAKNVPPKLRTALRDASNKTEEARALLKAQNVESEIKKFVDGGGMDGFQVGKMKQTYDEVEKVAEKEGADHVANMWAEQEEADFIKKMSNRMPKENAEFLKAFMNKTPYKRKIIERTPENMEIAAKIMAETDPAAWQRVCFSKKALEELQNATVGAYKPTTNVKGILVKSGLAAGGLVTLAFLTWPMRMSYGPMMLQNIWENSWQNPWIGTQDQVPIETQANLLGADSPQVIAFLIARRVWLEQADWYYGIADALIKTDKPIIKRAGEWFRDWIDANIELSYYNVQEGSMNVPRTKIMKPVEDGGMMYFDQNVVIYGPGGVVLWDKGWWVKRDRAEWIQLLKERPDVYAALPEDDQKNLAVEVWGSMEEAKKVMAHYQLGDLQKGDRLYATKDMKPLNVTGISPSEAYEKVATGDYVLVDENNNTIKSCG